MSSPFINERRIQLGLAALAGVLYFLGFVGFDIYPLTWICFVPVLLAIRKVAELDDSPVVGLEHLL